MVVMDNPSSVITQVSRDEEASKAAAERGESFYFCPTQGKKETKNFGCLSDSQESSLRSALLWQPGRRGDLFCTPEPSGELL